MGIVNKRGKRVWRFLTQEGVKTHLLSIRVPVTFPIDSLGLKEIVSEFDIICKTGKGNLSYDYVEKILAYYKSLGEQKSDA